MTENMNYPLDDMSTTSKSLVAFIDEQWRQHSALFMNNPDSHAALLHGIANVIPGAGGKSAELARALETYQHNYEVYYKALRDMAEMIDTAAQEMGLEDQQIARGFQR